MVTSKKKKKTTKVLISLVLISLIFSSNKKILYFKKDFTLKITLWQKKKKSFLAELTFKFVFFNSCPPNYGHRDRESRWDFENSP